MPRSKGYVSVQLPREVWRQLARMRFEQERPITEILIEMIDRETQKQPQEVE